MFFFFFFGGGGGGGEGFLSKQWMLVSVYNWSFRILAMKPYFICDFTKTGDPEIVRFSL